MQNIICLLQWAIAVKTVSPKCQIFPCVCHAAILIALVHERPANNAAVLERWLSQICRYPYTPSQFRISAPYIQCHKRSRYIRWASANSLSFLGTEGLARINKDANRFLRRALLNEWNPGCQKKRVPLLIHQGRRPAARHNCLFRYPTPMQDGRNHRSFPTASMPLSCPFLLPHSPFHTDDSQPPPPPPPPNTHTCTPPAALMLRSQGPPPTRLHLPE